MLLPKRVKYRRVHRGRMTGKATRGNTLAYGEFGLQATEPGLEEKRNFLAEGFKADKCHSLIYNFKTS